MRIIQQSLFRAICAIAIGALLVKYRQEMVQWMTITIGLLFILSGIVAVVMSYINRKTLLKLMQSINESVEAEEPATGNTRNIKASTGWGWGLSAGIGSIILGIVLVVIPDTFVNFLVYILSAFIILGAIQQFVSLAIANRWGSVGIMYWIMPSLLLIAGVVAVAYPDAIASAPLFFIGWCMMIYGIVECINGVKAYKCQKAATALAGLSQKPDFSNAETTEYVEVQAEEED